MPEPTMRAGRRIEPKVQEKSPESFKKAVEGRQKVVNVAMGIGTVLIIEPDSEVKPVLDNSPREPMTGEILAEHLSGGRKRVVRGPGGGNEMETLFIHKMMQTDVKAQDDGQQ